MRKCQGGHFSIHFVRVIVRFVPYSRRSISTTLSSENAEKLVGKARFSHDAVANTLQTPENNCLFNFSWRSVRVDQKKPSRRTRQCRHLVHPCPRCRGGKNPPKISGTPIVLHGWAGRWTRSTSRSFS